MTRGSSLIGWSLGDVAGFCASGAPSAGVTRVDDGTFFGGTDGSSVALSEGALQINNATYATSFADRKLETLPGIRPWEFVGGALVAPRCEASSQPTAAKEMNARAGPFLLRQSD
jgi:hypothetical protein